LDAVPQRTGVSAHQETGKEGSPATTTLSGARSGRQVAGLWSPFDELRRGSL
jgi:hypothetical protein